MKTKYYYLKNLELVKEGDESNISYSTGCVGPWGPVDSRFVGLKVSGLHSDLNFCRPVPKTLSPYIKLRTGDKLRKGDEYRWRNSKEWNTIVSSYGQALKKKDILQAQYRRPRVTKPVVEVKAPESVAKPVEKIEYRILAEGEVMPDVKPVESKVTFTHELKLLIKKYTLENGSDTPDYILAKYLANYLKAFDGAVKARTEWYSKGEKNV